MVLPEIFTERQRTQPMAIPLESKDKQFAVIEANAERIGAIARSGYDTNNEKGTVVIFRQQENNTNELEDWQIKYRPISQIEALISDWRNVGLQDMLIRYNPEVSVVCTFLYPNGAHTSYHFAIDG
ncbi:MAG: hypothetical protein AAGD25_08060 [Cyanobacteria bacterium P01_F01_bin.150]